MADVRSMLRAERESRRITHPHASYTSSGNLLCNLCEVPIKSDKAWSGHLHSTQHTLRLNRERDAAQARSPAPAGSKKRKAVEFEEPPVSERKKARAEDDSDKYPTPDGDEHTSRETTPAVESGPSAPTRTIHPILKKATTPIKPPAMAEEVTTADLEALERDLEAMEQETKLSALTAPATISAAAMAAGDDAQEPDEGGQRSKRDIEAEEAKEDAARALEEEFAEMESLQERAKKLRERRDLLRRPTEAPVELSADVETQAQPPEGAGEVNALPQAAESDDGEDESEEDDWTFGAR